MRTQKTHMHKFYVEKSTDTDTIIRLYIVIFEREPVETEQKWLALHSEEEEEEEKKMITHTVYYNNI